MEKGSVGIGSEQESLELGGFAVGSIAAKTEDLPDNSERSGRFQATSADDGGALQSGYPVPTLEGHVRRSWFRRGAKFRNHAQEDATAKPGAVYVSG